MVTKMEKAFYKLTSNEKTIKNSEIRLIQDW